MNKFSFIGKDPSKRSAKEPSQRQLRVAEEVRHVLSEIFLKTEFRDPELYGKKFTVTEVRMTSDLRHAIIYITRLGKNDIGELLPALKRVSPYLRNQLSRRLRLKFLPELKFQADTALEYAAKIDQVLHSPEVMRDLDKED